MKPNIAVIIGGDSSEIVIAEKSGRNIYSAVDTAKFIPWMVHIVGRDWKVIKDGIYLAEIDKRDFSFSYNGEKINFDFVYITIHGTPGEDGILQGYFEMLKIPYSTSNVHSSSLTFNKWYCNQYLKNFGIEMANSVKLSKGKKVNTNDIINKLGLPLFVKPNAGGSSFGITKVKKAEELESAIVNAWEESDDALVEEFIEGTEVTCGLVILKDKTVVLPLTEIVPNKEFFNFEAKYTAGVANEITPARISEKLTEKCQGLSAQIVKHCDCYGIVRIDYILHNNEFFFLEINTTPGMTETSLVPQQIEAMGLTLKEFITLLVEEKLILNKY